MTRSSRHIKNSKQDVKVLIAKRKNNYPDMNLDKGKFILRIFEYSCRPNVSNVHKKRIMNLTTKEIEKREEINQEILARLKRIELKLENYLPKKRKSENNKNFIIKHTPQKTAEILRKFKIEGSGFKELVHQPNKINYNLDDYRKDIEKARETFNTLRNVPYGMYKSIEQLILLMENDGRACFEKTQEHPYNNKKCEKVEYEKVKNNKDLIGGYKKDVTLTQLIRNFKQNYRFDTLSYEATILKDLIKNILHKKDKKSFPKGDKDYVYATKAGENKVKVIIKYKFDEHFDMNSVFYTWVPNIRNFLSEIALDILKHGNINGEDNFGNNKKNILFSIERENEDNDFNKIKFIIFDQESVVKKDRKTFYDKIKEKGANLKSICDWTIEADFIDGKSYAINFLSVEKQETFKEIDRVGGFKHVLTFYE